MTYSTLDTLALTTKLCMCDCISLHVQTRNQDSSGDTIVCVHKQMMAFVKYVPIVQCGTASNTCVIHVLLL